MAIKCGGLKNVLGKMADTWGSDWQYFGVLAELHAYLYLPVVFWPIVAYGYSNIAPKALLSSQLEFNGSMGYSISMHGRGIS